MPNMQSIQIPYAFSGLSALLRRSELGELTNEERMDALARAEMDLEALQMRKVGLEYAIRKASTEVEALKIVGVPTGTRIG